MAKVYIPVKMVKNLKVNGRTISFAMGKLRILMGTFMMAAGYMIKDMDLVFIHGLTEKNILVNGKMGKNMVPELHMKRKLEFIT